MVETGKKASYEKSFLRNLWMFPKAPNIIAVEVMKHGLIS